MSVKPVKSQRQASNTSEKDTGWLALRARPTQSYGGGGTGLTAELAWPVGSVHEHLSSVHNSVLSAVQVVGKGEKKPLLGRGPKIKIK